MQMLMIFLEKQKGRLSLQIVKNEGRKSLYLGLTPALMRAVIYGGLRLGLYEPSKYASELAFESTNVLVKIFSVGFAGAVATALANPVEVLKVRMQMNSKTARGSIGQMRKIASEEGVASLWTGVAPAMTRAAVSQLVTYDESKRALTRRTSLQEGFYLHLWYLMGSPITESVTFIALAYAYGKYIVVIYHTQILVLQMLR